MQEETKRAVDMEEGVGGLVVDFGEGVVVVVVMVDGGGGGGGGV